MDMAVIERTIAIIGGIIVGIVAFWALKLDWKTPGIENHVFKLMLFLLGVGAILAILAGANILGNFPKAA